MKVYVSPREKEYVFETLDQMRIPYVKKEFTVWVCEYCAKIYREKPEVCDCRQCRGFEAEFTVISLGDIISEKLNFCLERKKGTDLMHSLQDDRIYIQLAHMTEIFSQNCALVFEGSFEEVAKEERKRVKIATSKMSRDKAQKLIRNCESRIKQMLSIPATCMQYGVSFIQVEDFRTLCRMLKYFDYKCGELPKLRTKRKKISELLPPLVRVISGIPMFEQKLALRIYQKYKTIPELQYALDSGSMEKIEGVGKKRIEKLKEWLL